MSDSPTRDQQHPQEREDRSVMNQLLSGEPTDYNLTELGRLRIRYQNFPGARELQKDLDLILQRWGLTQEELFKKTISIHSQGSLNRNHSLEEQQDWS
jgi:Protein of unknown function (DUF3288)